MATLPDALLLLAPGCAHCLVVLQVLSEALNAGRFGRLEAVRVAEHPELLDSLGTPTVPWLRIGPFQLEGLYMPTELAAWIEHVAHDTGWEAYFSLRLAQGKLERALKLVREEPHPAVGCHWSGGLARHANGGPHWGGRHTGGFRGPRALADYIPDLVALTRSSEPKIRAEGCHYLALTNVREVVDHVRPLLDDTDLEVRHIAEETVERLAGHRAC